MLFFINYNFLDRGRYPAETSERVLYKDLSPSREEARSLRIQQPFPEERRGLVKLRNF